MTNTDFIEHGGRLGDAARRWQIPRDQWLDLSTGINPQGWPVPTIPPSLWQRLPEEDDGLEAAIRQWSGAVDVAGCIAVPGSQAAIQSVPRLRSPCRVGVPERGYQEHARCWSGEGHEVVPVNLENLSEDDQALNKLDVLVCINPNNPTGMTIPREKLLKWHQHLQGRSGWLVLDEAFMAGNEQESLAAATDTSGLIVLKSLGKFYGLAGLRAGAALGDPLIISRLASDLGPWAVSGPARYLIRAALNDYAWQEETRDRLRRDSARLAELLKHHDLPLTGSTILFCYTVFPGALKVADELARRGIWVRRFEGPDALRFGLPGDESEWRRLDRALAEAMSGKTTIL